MDDYQQFIHKSRYARYLEDKGRRETWEETVTRYKNFWIETVSAEKDDSFELADLIDEIKLACAAIVNQEVMPSMRALMSAGPALSRDHIAGYNCGYLPIDNPRSFDELFYILMCGTGVGFSVESKYVNQLPEVPDRLDECDEVIVVADSKGGWARGLQGLLSSLYRGRVPKWDLSKVRASGARLKTFGGRASGPEPLEALFRYTVSLFRRCSSNPNHRGQRLSTIEAHDLVCRIADTVVVGGVRRSALISLGDLHDSSHATAKSGAWYDTSPERALANNSSVFEEKPDLRTFSNEWVTLYESKSGERGIFNRAGAALRCEQTGRRSSSHAFGTNPCGEIILRPHQFCNLTEVIVRPDDTYEDLERKVRLCTFLGTLQSTLTNFRHIRKVWQNNCEEERLLGVSLTGIMDHPILSTGLDWTLDKTDVLLSSLKEAAIDENAKWAERLGINRSAAITTIKPSGTVSQLTNTASGIHPRYSPFYIRRVRMDIKDPLSAFLITQEVPHEVDVMKPDSHYVFEFPQAAPKGSVIRDEQTALEQLSHWLIFSENWTEHNPSATIYVREDEWLDVGAWVYKNIDRICGLSFLPHTEHIYKQAPYEEITEEEYKDKLDSFPSIDWDTFTEEQDNVTTYKELACTAGFCEV